ncbi:Hexuronate transporter [Castellaniella defragrans]
MSAANPTIGGSSRYNTVIGFLLYLFIALSYVVNAMDRSVFGQLTVYVKRDLHLSLTEAGFVTTVFAIGFGLTGFVAGYLLDRYRRKNVLVVGMLVYSIFTILMAMSSGFFDITLYRLITGIGEALQQTALWTMAGIIFAKHRNLSLGGMNCAYGIGNFLGPIIGIEIFLYGSSNWHLPLYVFGVIGIIYALLILFFLPQDFSEYGKEEATREKARAEEAKGTAATVDRYFTTRNITIALVLVGVANLLSGTVNYSYLGLYPTFLKAHLGFSPTDAAVATSMYGIGGFTGLISGYLADKYGERIIIFVALVGSITSGALMFNLATALWAQVVLSLIFGSFSSGFLFVNLYALTQRVVPARHVGKASGVASSSHYIGAGFSGAIFGALVTGMGWGGASMIIMIGLPVIAGICIALIKVPPKQAIA